MGGSATWLEDAWMLMQCSLDCDWQAFLPFAAVMMNSRGQESGESFYTAGSVPCRVAASSKPKHSLLE